MRGAARALARRAGALASRRSRPDHGVRSVSQALTTSSATGSPLPPPNASHERHLHASGMILPHGSTPTGHPFAAQGAVRLRRSNGSLLGGMRHFSDAATTEVVVPSMGESVSDGAVSALLKGPGDSVKVDDVIAQIETDKVTIDVRSQDAGVLQKLTVRVGDTVKPGTVVAIVGKEEAGAGVGPPAAAAEPLKEDTSPVPPEVLGGLSTVLVPSMGESMTDGVIAVLLKKPGDSVAADEVIAQIETDKVTIDVRSPDAGIVEVVSVHQGETVTPGSKVAVVRKGEGAAAAAPPPPSAPAAAPAAKEAAPAKPAAPPPPPPPKPPVDKILHNPPEVVSVPTKERERRVPMTRLRKRVAQRLKDSQNTFALLTTFNEVDMTNLMQMRNTFKDDFLKVHGVKLGFMSAFVKAAASALQQEPVVNAVIDGDDVIYRDYVDISIAVGTPKGLVVPVIRSVDQLSFAGIEKTIAELGKKAKDGTISIDDMAGGTFTISNGGVYGSLISTPIINPPQSAILGMHAVQQRPMVVGKEVLPRPMMYVALTYDHRLIDGREAVLFLRRIKDVVEDPRRLLLDL